MGININVKRGSKSFNYFVIVFGILSSFAVAVISVIDIYWLAKIFFLVISLIICFYFCFWNDWFRNKIVGVMSKIQDKIENRDV